MRTVRRVRLIKVGNSHGVRIPKAWLEQLGLGEEVEIALGADHIVIHRPHLAREGWEHQFRQMAAQGDDQLIDLPTLTRWDQDESPP